MAPVQPHKFCLALAVFVTVSACGPVYRTLTEYEPPTDPVARASLSNCEMLQMQCMQVETMKADACQQRADAEYEACHAKVSACEQASETKYNQCLARQRICSKDYCVDYCPRTACAPNEALCQGQYNRCYIAAGGKVTQRTVCVDRCENVPVPAPAVAPPAPAAAPPAPAAPAGSVVEPRPEKRGKRK